MKIALAVIESTTNIENNIEKMKEQIKNANTCDLILFSETVLTGFIADFVKEGRDLSLKLESEKILRLINYAKEFSINIGFGFYRKKRIAFLKNEYYKSYAVIDKCGDIKVLQDKIIAWKKFIWLQKWNRFRKIYNEKLQRYNSYL